MGYNKGSPPTRVVLVDAADESDYTAKTSGTGTSAMQVQGPAADAATAAGNPVPSGGRYLATPTTLSNGQAGMIPLGLYRRQLIGIGKNSAPVNGRTTVNWANSDNADGSEVAPLAVQVMGINGSGTIDHLPGDATAGLCANLRPATSGGLLLSRVVTGTTGVIKASAGQIYTLFGVQNLNAGIRYLHIYNKATAPTLSTDTPVLTIPLAASFVGNVTISDIGVAFATGMSWAYTTDNVAIPTTAGTSAELFFTAGYK